MNFDFGNNKGIDLEQEFLPMYNCDIVDTIYRFDIYGTTPNNLFPVENVEYYTLLDKDTGEVALFGIQYILHGKILQSKTRMLIAKGDEETFQFVAEELVDRLSKKKMAELKSSDSISTQGENTSL